MTPGSTSKESQGASHNLIVVALQFSSRERIIKKVTLDRTKNKILSFGYGPHYCLGAQLAKQEAQILIEELLNAFPKITTNPQHIHIYRQSSHVRGLEKLTVYTDDTLYQSLKKTQLYQNQQENRLCLRSERTNL